MLVAQAGVALPWAAIAQAAAEQGERYLAPSKARRTRSWAHRRTW